MPHTRAETSEGANVEEPAATYAEKLAPSRAVPENARTNAIEFQAAFSFMSHDANPRAANDSVPTRSPGRGSQCKAPTSVETADV